MAVTRITDDSTRAELEEEMRAVRASLRAMPEHWCEKRALLHEKLDALLTDWQRAKP